MSNSVRPHRWQPTRLPHPWDSPGKNTGVGCHFLLQIQKLTLGLIYQEFSSDLGWASHCYGTKFDHKMSPKYWSNSLSLGEDLRNGMFSATISHQRLQPSNVSWWNLRKLRKENNTCHLAAIRLQPLPIVNSEETRDMRIQGPTDPQRPHGLQLSRLLCPQDTRQEYWSGVPLSSPNYSLVQRKYIFSLQDADYLKGVKLGNEKQMNFCILFMSLDMFLCLLVYNLRELE